MLIHLDTGISYGPAVASWVHTAEAEKTVRHAFIGTFATNHLVATRNHVVVPLGSTRVASAQDYPSTAVPASALTKWTWDLGVLGVAGPVWSLCLGAQHFCEGANHVGFVIVR